MTSDHSDIEEKQQLISHQKNQFISPFNWTMWIRGVDEWICSPWWTGISLSAYRVDPKTLMNSRLYSDTHRWAHELTNSFSPMYHRLHSPRGLCEALRRWRGKHLPGHSFEALMVYRGVSPTLTPQGVTCRGFQKCRIRDPKQGGSPGTWESASWGNGPGSLGKGGQARLVLEERHSQDRGGHKAGWRPGDPNPRWPGGARRASQGAGLEMSLDREVNIWLPSWAEWDSKFQLPPLWPSA